MAIAQPRTLETIVGAEIGQCVLSRSSLAVEIDSLKAKITQLEDQIKKGPPK